jgi:hypothetical protein
VALRAAYQKNGIKTNAPRAAAQGELLLMSNGQILVEANDLVEEID